MIMFERAVRASVNAFAVIAIAGCGGRSAAEYNGASYLAAVSSAAAADEEIQTGRLGSATAPSIGEGDGRMMLSTLVEQHHFNVYKNFLAMLDASADARSGGKQRGESLSRSDAAASDGAEYFACSVESLVKQGD